MATKVRALSDIVDLFVMEEGEKNMGGPKKTRAELLDKMVQFIWDYQDRHGGDTPRVNVIERHLNIANAGGGYYIAILVDQGRINKISSHPFRVTITDHPLNLKAIDRFKKIRERLERADENERKQIRERQEREAAEEQRATDHNAALALVGQPHSDTVVADTPAPVKVFERPAIARSWERQMDPNSETDRLTEFTNAHTRVREINKEVKALMPKLLRIADERDLVFELLSRGYRVDKVR